jgi:hypothetical protein
MNDNGRLRCLGVGDYYPKGCMIYHKMTIYPSLNNGYKINIELSSPNDYREEVPGGKGIIVGNTFYFPETMNSEEAVKYMINHLITEINNDIKEKNKTIKDIKEAYKIYLKKEV